MKHTDRPAAEEALFLLNVGQDISEELATQALLEVINTDDAQKRIYLLGSLLHGLMAKGPTATEVRGLLRGAWSYDNFDPSSRPKIDTDKRTVTYAGSGKKGVKTVNVSSLASFVAACDDVVVVKLCSPSTSSVTGSQDFVSLIGARSDMHHSDMATIAQEIGVGFFEVERILPKFASRYSGIFVTPHAMSFALVTMTCAYRTDRTVYGLAHPNLELSLEVLENLLDGQIEIVTSTQDEVHYVDEAVGIGSTGYVSRGSIGHPEQELDIRAMTGDSTSDVLEAISSAESAHANVIKGLEGLRGKRPVLSRQIAVNAALLLRRENETLSEAYARALSIIESGQPLQKIEEFIRLSDGTKARLDELLSR